MSWRCAKAEIEASIEARDDKPEGDDVPLPWRLLVIQQREDQLAYDQSLFREWRDGLGLKYRPDWRDHWHVPYDLDPILNPWCEGTPAPAEPPLSSSVITEPEPVAAPTRASPSSSLPPVPPPPAIGPRH